MKYTTRIWLAQFYPQYYFDITQLLSTHIDSVAPEKDDPLRIILQELGTIPTEAEAVGEEGTPQYNEARMETSLNLTNKFEVPEEEDSSTKALFLRCVPLFLRTGHLTCSQHQAHDCRGHSVPAGEKPA